MVFTNEQYSTDDPSMLQTNAAYGIVPSSSVRAHRNAAYDVVIPSSVQTNVAYNVVAQSSRH